MGIFFLWCCAVVVRTIYREREGRNMHRRVDFYIKKHKIKCDIIRYNLPLVARSSNLIA